MGQEDQKKLRKEIKDRLEEYLQNLGIDVRKKFRCLNPEHEDENPSMSYDKKRKKVHCFSCLADYDIFDVMEIKTGLHGKELFEYGYEYFGLKKNQKNKPLEVKSVKVEGEDGENLQKDENLKKCKEAERGGYIKKTQENFANSAGEGYMKERGITTETARICGVGYDEKMKSVVLEYRGKNYYITRSIEKKEYKKPAGESEPLYEIGNNDEKMIYVTEGQIDALSLLQAGATRVVAIGGGGTSKLKELSPKPMRAIIVCDNDDAGEKTAERIKNELEKFGITCIKVNPPKEYKDSNDVLKANPELLSGLVEKWENEAKELPTNAPDNVEEYVRETLNAELLRFQKFKDRKTGFSNLDEETSLYPGLYVLGAISSLGKTTFAHQLADQLSKRGDSVLYFSLEQNRLELVTKGIARLMAQKDMKNALTAIDIRRGGQTAGLNEAIREYGKLAANENIIECSFEYTTADVVNYVRKYIEESRKSPVVIIDYLQVLRPSERLATREGIDANVKELKKLQSENDIVVLVISSFNRMNYTSLVDYESFKESGGIEYTADVVWGLQLKEITKDVFEKKSVNEKREAIRKAKLANPRELELVCLKNRYGRSSYKCGFKYYAKYDLFVPENEYFEDIGVEDILVRKY